MRRLAAALLLLVAAAPAAAETGQSAVKAAFVFNFIKLVSWPDARLPDGGSPLQVCVFNGGEMEPALRHALTGKVIGGHPLQLSAQAGPEDLDACHVLYLGGRGGSRTAALMARVSGRGVLVVDEGARFSWPNGMIRLFEEQDRIRFELNLQALERAGLKVDPRLIRLARIVSS